jgi:uncharacterized membrane protein YecN with MAPEG domain
MTALQLFSIEACWLTIFLLYLSMRVIKQRRNKRVAIGDNHDPSITRAISAQTNFLNYVPIALILQLTLVFLHVNVLVLLILVLLLVVGRSLHAYSLYVTELRTPPTYKFRMSGMFMTFASLLLSGITLLFYAF